MILRSEVERNDITSLYRVNLSRSDVYNRGPHEVENAVTCKRKRINHAAIFDLLPQCSSEVDQIAGYPDYSKDPNQLDATQKKVLTDIAQKIVSSHHTNLPYTAFIVIGHADAAMRKPVRERPEFEQRVSEGRADAARNALLTWNHETPRGTEVAKKLAYRPEGKEASNAYFVRLLHFHRPKWRLTAASSSTSRSVFYHLNHSPIRMTIWKAGSGGC
jgi:hypothetical protein